MKNKEIYTKEKLAECIRSFSFENFGISVEYDTVYSCENSGRCEDYCRCGVITNARIECFDIEQITKTIISRAEKIIDFNEVKKYSLSRLINTLCNDEKLYEIKIIDGYYGQEVGGVFYSQTSALVESVNHILVSSDLDAVKSILSLEYGYLLPVVEKAKKVFIKEIENENISYNQDYYVRLNPATLGRYKNYNGVVGVFVETPNGLRLIDGYHRYFSKKSKKHLKILVIK